MQLKKICGDCHWFMQSKGASCGICTIHDPPMLTYAKKEEVFCTEYQKEKKEDGNK